MQSIMRLLGIASLLALSATIAAAQPRPGAFTTLVTTDPSITSICVGGNAPSAPSTCLGGLQAGPLVVNQGITLPSFTPAVTTNRVYQASGALFFNGLPVYVGGVIGPGPNLTDATTTPTISGGFGAGATIVGKGSFFRINVGSGSVTSGGGTFGATFANQAVCVVSANNLSGGVLSIVNDASTYVINSTTGWSTGTALNVICRGF